MRHTTTKSICLLLWVTASGVSSPCFAETPSSVELAPCTIEMIDGTKVEAQLAAQFDMPEHLIVYSPRLATVRAVFRQHVHALTIDGKRRELNPKRALTDEDKKLIGRRHWPDETPNHGRKPLYTVEQWGAPKHLLVWASPGKSGRLEDPKNWLLDGQPLTAMSFEKPSRMADSAAFGLDTDILLPAADTPYTVKYQDRARGGLMARHVTVDDNAMLQSSVLTTAGNVWLAPLGRLRTRYTITVKGQRHTFFYNDKPRFTAEQNNELQGGYPAANYVNGIGYSVAQYFRVEKTGGASIEFLGTIQTSDDFQMPAGVTIVAPSSQLMPGKRSTQRIGQEAVLRLHSGSQFCKAENATYYDQDLIVEGRVEAGTREHPITEDCRLGVSFKDRSCYGKEGPSVGRAAPGLVFRPTASVKVHTVDPATARLVIGWHGRENTWQRSRMKAESGKDYMAFPRKIEMEIHAALALDAVLLDEVHRGGIRLLRPELRADFKNVRFGDHNEASPHELFAPRND